MGNCPYLDEACGQHALCKKNMEHSCLYCSNDFVDSSVGYAECTRMDELTDDEYEELCTSGFVCNCSQFVLKCESVFD